MGDKQEPNYDTPEDLHRYREIYTSAIDKHSEGTLGDVVRNSHVLSSLAVAICFPPLLHEIVYNVGAYVFGSQGTTISVLEGIERSSWYNQSPHEVASLPVSENHSASVSDDDKDPDPEQEEADGYFSEPLVLLSRLGVVHRYPRPDVSPPYFDRWRIRI
ncbi:hypothetical protein C8Q74DRAFT_1234760 [Fomes fomentarius]|nr:hypothetical protein C8Q74DRAFT_1234760 [Fomes fomentarius]